MTTDKLYWNDEDNLFLIFGYVGTTIEFKLCNQ
jgi:hypothetical protein